MSGESFPQLKSENLIILDRKFKNRMERNFVGENIENLGIYRDLFLNFHKFRKNVANSDWK